MSTSDQLCLAARGVSPVTITGGASPRRSANVGRHAALCAAVVSLGASICAAQTPILHYTFDDGLNPTANDGSLGGGYVGDLLGDVIFVPHGDGLAVEFFGDSDWVIPAGDENAFDIGDDDFTLVVTVLTTNVEPEFDSQRFVIGKELVSVDPGYIVGVRRSTGIVVVQLSDGVSSSALFGSVAVNDGQWHEIRLVRDDDTMVLYVDGFIDDTVILPGDFGSTAPNDDNFVIGGRTIDPEQVDDFIGMIDDVRIYDAAMHPAGTVLSHQKISDIDGGFTGVLDDEDRFGRALAAVGDLDGDGVTDVAVGTGNDDDGGTDRGAIWILFLNNDGTVKSHQKISNTEGGFAGELDDSDRFGISIAALGDHDGDGVVDLAVGARQDDDGGADRGAVWILFLNADGTVKSEQKISGTLGGFGGLLADGDRFGESVARLGDLDGDGIGDLAVGADRDDDGGLDRGALWILFLNNDGTVKSSQKISTTQGGFAGSVGDGDQFGESCVSLGDLDNDGVGDLAVGANFGDGGGVDEGAIWILFLNSDGTVNAHQKISEAHAGFTGDLDNGDEFAYVGGVGDLDGDCVTDLAVGAYNDDDGGFNRGALWMLFLNQDGTVKSHQKISDTDGGFAGGLDNEDKFGIAAASIGDLNGDGKTDLVVGAFNDDGGGIDRGAVWVLFLDGVAITDCNGNGLDDACDIASGFSTDCNANGLPDDCEFEFTATSKLLPDDGEADDQFGTAVATNGTTAVVGARFDDDNGADSGAAYVIDIATGQQLFKLLPNDGASGDRFGESVAISGATIIVGALWDDDNGVDSGSAYVFDATTGAQIDKLVAIDGAAGDTFAFKVAIDGDTMLASASADDDNGTDSGSAYVFVRDEKGAWSEQAKLLPDDGAASDFFGSRVSVGGDTAVVGSLFDDDNGADSGSAYVFVRDGNGDWSQQAKLLPDDGQAGDNFGGAVAIRGDTAFIGARLDDDNGVDSGSAYVFVRDGNGVWSQQFKLLPEDGDAGAWFGFSVAMSGDTAIVGAFLHEHDVPDSGSAYLFDVSAGEQIAEFPPSDGAAFDWYGLAVAISGNAAIVGASLDDDNGVDSGSAYVFERSSDCNANGIPDTCDIADASSADCNANGIPDECEDLPPCPADLDGDCIVAAPDLVTLLGAWGKNPGHPADLDGDGIVGTPDLLFLLGAWGMCR